MEKELKTLYFKNIKSGVLGLMKQSIGPGTMSRLIKYNKVYIIMPIKQYANYFKKYFFHKTKFHLEKGTYSTGKCIRQIRGCGLFGLEVFFFA